jgi:hypothetical protein
MKLKIIETPDHILAVSDEEIKEDDLCILLEYALDSYKFYAVNHIQLPLISKCIDINNNDVWFEIFGKKYECEGGLGTTVFKIIAHLPKGAAKELDLPLLPEIVIEDDVEKLAIQKYPISKGGDMWMPTRFDLDQSNRQEGFIEGYKAATKVYSEEDLRKIVVVAYNNGYNDRDTDIGHGSNLPYSFEFIQSIKQPKVPQWFVAEMEEECGYGANGYYSNIVLKTTIIEGKTYLVGTYLYE